MADLDTRNKRASAIGLVLVTRMLLPNPFGTIDAAARLQVGWCYKGIAAGSPVSATGQNPPASRYRFAYQLTDVIQAMILWL